MDLLSKIFSVTYANLLLNSTQIIFSVYSRDFLYVYYAEFKACYKLFKCKSSNQKE